jgi:hypothetical protein
MDGPSVFAREFSSQRRGGHAHLYYAAQLTLYQAPGAVVGLKRACPASERIALHVANFATKRVGSPTKEFPTFFVFRSRGYEVSTKTFGDA